MTEHMPVLRRIASEFERDRPLAGWGVLLNLHLTHETLALGGCLRTGGATVWYLPSNRNPTSPQVMDKVRAIGARVIADPGQLDDVARPADGPPPRVLAVEGNGRLFRLIHDGGSDAAILRCIVGISEHTSGGGRQVDVFAGGEGATFRVPVVAVYRDPLKGPLETGLGTSQSTVAALLRGFGASLAGRRVLIVGYGHVGKGVARSLVALGARVEITDISAEERLAARLVGLRPVALADALPDAELCVTTTGASSVIDAALLDRCRDGLRLVNVSDRPDEIDLRGCERIASAEPARTLWRTPGGNTVEVLGDGLQVNHVIGTGNPASLMDLSFSLHALVVQWLASEPRTPARLAVPPAVRERVITFALEA